MQPSVFLSVIMATLIGSAAAAKINCGCKGEDYITGLPKCFKTTFDTAQYKDCPAACNGAGNQC